MNKWKIGILSVLVCGIAGLAVAATSPSTSADNESVGNDLVGWTRADGSYGIRVSSSGHIIGGADNQTDIGSPVRGIRNVYIGDNGTLNFTAFNTSFSSNSTISIIGSYVLLNPTGSFNMTEALPTFSLTNARDGDILYVVNPTTQTVVLNSRTSVTGTGLQLSTGSTRLSYLDAAEFIFNSSTNAWIQKGYSDNLR